MMSTLPTLVTPEVVIMTTFGIANVDKVGIMTTQFWVQRASNHFAILWQPLLSPILAKLASWQLNFECRELVTILPYYDNLCCHQCWQSWHHDNTILEFRELVTGFHHYLKLIEFLIQLPVKFWSIILILSLCVASFGGSQSTSRVI